jgi:adenosylmethionine-8-amino-7-oxononanoate aminotransferase
MVVFAKGVTSGYLPLGGVVVSGRVAAPFWDEPGHPFRHGQTYAGHATCCAAALANIQILERDGLVARGQELEGDLVGALRDAVGDHPLVTEIRGGTGLMAAVELRDGVVPNEAYIAVRESGKVLTRPLLKGLAFSPPLVITPAELEEMAAGVKAGLDALHARAGALAAASA